MDYLNFIKVRSMYKKVDPTYPNAKYEAVSVNNSYVHVYFLEDKKHEYSEGEGVVLIKLTDEGKEKFDSI